MAYSAITNAEIDQDSPITQTLMTKYRDNIILAAEGLWHPYDRTEPDGSADGVFYDFATDGAVASVETPDFDADYDYMLVWDGISTSSGTLARFGVEAYRDTDAAYDTITLLSAGSASASKLVYGRFTLHNPKGWATENLYARDLHTFQSDSSIVGSSDLEIALDGTIQTFSKLRFSWNAGDIDAGKIMLLRRKILWGL